MIKRHVYRTIRWPGNIACYAKPNYITVRAIGIMLLTLNSWNLDYRYITAFGTKHIIHSWLMWHDRHYITLATAEFWKRSHLYGHFGQYISFNHHGTTTLYNPEMESMNINWYKTDTLLIYSLRGIIPISHLSSIAMVVSASTIVGHQPASEQGILHVWSHSGNVVSFLHTLDADSTDIS